MTGGMWGGVRGGVRGGVKKLILGKFNPLGIPLIASLTLGTVSRAFAAPPVPVEPLETWLAWLDASDRITSLPPTWGIVSPQAGQSYLPCASPASTRPLCYSITRIRGVLTSAPMPGINPVPGTANMSQSLQEYLNSYLALYASRSFPATPASSAPSAMTGAGRQFPACRNAALAAPTQPPTVPITYFTDPTAIRCSFVNAAAAWVRNALVNDRTSLVNSMAGAPAASPQTAGLRAMLWDYDRQILLLDRLFQDAAVWQLILLRTGYLQAVPASAPQGY